MQNLAKGSAIATALLSGTGIYLYPKYKDVIFKPAKQPVNHYDTCVIGGGIVGLSIARDLATRGQKVILFEKNKSFASECSGASSGLSTVTNYECDENSLEFKLLKRSLQLQEVLYEKFGLSNQKGHHLIDCGRILLPSNNDKNNNEDEELEKLIHNCQKVSDATPSAGKTKMLDKTEIMNLEPSLNPLKISKSGGGEIATEGIVEPFLLATAHNYSALLHGAELQNNSKVQSVYRTRDPEDESMKWVVLIEDPSHQETLGIQKAISTNVINCTGLHSMKTEKIVPGKDHPNPKKFKIFPRTGEFVMFDPKFLDQDPNNQNHHNQLNSILQPFKQEKLHHLGDQLRIYQNTFGNLVVGPIFQDPGITEKIDYKNDVQAIAKLQNLLKAHLPKLTDCQFIGSYSCVWPVVTDQKDYIIEKKDNNWTTVANIRSLGLNNSTAIGEYVADLVTDTKKNKIDSGNNNHNSSDSVADSFSKMKTSPELPKINEIIKNYCKNGDGSVDLYGQNWKVNHQGTRISLDQACLKLK